MELEDDYFDEDDELLCSPSTVPCLLSLDDLEKACESHGVKGLSSTTKEDLFYCMLKRLGPRGVSNLVSKLVQNKVISNWEDEFEVEDILDHDEDEEEGKTYYLIKWFGWGPYHNTWEPAENLNCYALLHEYHVLVKKGVTKTRKRPSPQENVSAQMKQHIIDEMYYKLLDTGLLDKMSLKEMIDLQKPQRRAFSAKSNTQPQKAVVTKKFNSKKQRKIEVQKALKMWEVELNNLRKGHDPAPILVENKVDLEGPPDNFIFINERRPGLGITIDQDPLVGCECEDCYVDRKSCCAVGNDSEPPYYKSTSRLRLPRGIPIYECNTRCKCGPECHNRVVQKGRRVKICIFRTRSKGWGVRTLQPIKKGTFVIEYVGEVITNEEAENRGKKYDAKGMTYLFDLDFHDTDGPYSVDAGTYGNASHFINHSCDPNLEVHVVWINNLNPLLPHICLYAKRDIAKNEELTFDYNCGKDVGEDVSETEQETGNETANKAEQALNQECLAESSGSSIWTGESNSQATCHGNFASSSICLGESRSNGICSDGSNTFICPREPGNSSGTTLRDLWDMSKVPTPPASDVESLTAKEDKTSRFTMQCHCGAKTCRKFLFF